MARIIAAAAIAICFLPHAARAQSVPRFSAGVGVGGGLTSQDENFAGGGLLTGARLGFDLTPKAAVELSVTRIAHNRTFAWSRISVEGRSIFTGLSLKYDFTRGRVRPFVVAGYGINNHRHTWTDRDGARTREANSHGYNGGGGVMFRHGRWEHGPEARFYMLAIDQGSSAAFILTGAYRASLRF